MHFSTSVYIKKFTCFFRVIVDFEIIDYKEISIFSFFFIYSKSLSNIFSAKDMKRNFNRKNGRFFYYFKQRIFSARINK